MITAIGKDVGTKRPNNKKKKKWIRPRHYFFRNFFYPIFGLISYVKYGARVQRFKEQGKRQYLILFNHQTAFDQFFVGMAFRGPIYYMASEDIFSKGFASAVIRYLVEPIPIKKQTTDVRAVLNCMKVVSEGGTIAIAPEGNRTYSGETVHMNPSIAMLAKKLNVPVALYRIEGGYGVQPRWSDVTRRGRINCYVSRVIEPEEYKDMSYDELYEQIKQGLYVNEAVADHSYYHKRSAEYLDRVFYTCPYCGLTTMHAEGDTVECEKCQRRVRYLPTKELQGVGFDFPHKFVLDWYRAQEELMNSLDPSLYCDEPIWTESVSLSEVIPYKKKLIVAKRAQASIYGDRVCVRYGGEELTMPFSEMSGASVLGKNKVNYYYKDKIYQLKGDKHMNALKFVNLYYRVKNLEKGDENDKFLGL